MRRPVDFRRNAFKSLRLRPDQECFAHQRAPQHAWPHPVVVLSVACVSRRDPGAVSSAIAASRRSPQTVSVELPVAAWSQPASSGFFDCAVRLRSGSVQNDRLVEGAEISRPVDSDLSTGMNTAPFSSLTLGLKPKASIFFA
ncbi:MAG: hypothetical protein JWN42_1722 [Candidatus Angelobacter sp.]|nr:hypothetical protein [Candidatus Angelobacter sp.]